MIATTRASPIYQPRTCPPPVARKRPGGNWPTKKHPMTIIVAIKARDGIVVVSDSQTTNPATGQKYLNATKLHAIQFKNTSAIVAEGGNAAFSGRAIEKMREYAPEI